MNQLIGEQEKKAIAYVTEYGIEKAALIFLSGKCRIVPYEIGFNRECKRPKISYENGLGEEVL